MTDRQKFIVHETLWRATVKLSIRDLGAKDAAKNLVILETILRSMVAAFAIAWDLEFHGYVGEMQKIVDSVLHDVSTMTPVQLLVLNYQMMKESKG